MKSLAQNFRRLCLALFVEASQENSGELLRDIVEYIRARGVRAIGFEGGLPEDEIFSTANFSTSLVKDVNLARALKYIREHACEGLQIDQVAAFAGVSRSVLQRRFRATLNETVHEAVIKVRLERARALLMNTNLSLPDVAERSGFKHCEYLGVVFKKYFGQTPAQFRKASRPFGKKREMKNLTAHPSISPRRAENGFPRRFAHEFHAGSAAIKSAAGISI